MRVVLATRNPGKVRELAAILDDPDLEIAGPEALAGIDFPDEGDAYEENARVKACTAARATGCIAFGDDSGLEVDALDGRPGPHSARYGGPGLDDAGRCRELLRELDGLPDRERGARFVCVAALATPDGQVVVRRGTCEGRILQRPRGTSGFGYDPVFGVGDGSRSMAELSAEEKNRISHRARAFRGLAPELRRL